MKTQHDVLIVGAGPTGLTLAIDLARRGINVRLIDAAPTPFAGSRGKGVQPRTLEVFDNLGVADAVLAGGGTYPAFKVHLGPLSVPRKSIGSALPATRATPYPNLWMIPQFRTEAILRERLASFAQKAEFGTTLVDFTQDDKRVVATLQDGSRVSAQYLIGADGGHSQVRRTLGLSLIGEGLGDQAMLVADVELTGLRADAWHVWPWAKGGRVGLCPLPDTNLFQLMAPAAFGGDDLAAAIAGIARCRVERIAWQSQYRPSIRMVERYRVGRVFLAGDAAHVHPPSGGQGLNTGVQDAFNLGWKLAQVLNGGDQALLDSYEAERLPVAASVLGLSKDLHVSGSAKRGKDTDQLAINYRSSPLSSGIAYAGLHPGDRMPDTRLSDGRRLFEAMRGHRALQVIAGDGVTLLVRPDGYIAHIGSGDTSPRLQIDADEVRLATRL